MGDGSPKDAGIQEERHCLRSTSPQEIGMVGADALRQQEIVGERQNRVEVNENLFGDGP